MIALFPRAASAHLCHLVLALSLSIGPAAAQSFGSEPIWPPRVEALAPGPSESAVKAELPADLAVQPASRELGAEKAAYLGRWSGYLCRKHDFDIRIAVLAVRESGADLVYAGASAKSEPEVERAVARFAGQALVADLTRDRQLVVELRADGHMKAYAVERGRPGRWCLGLLSREPG